MNQMVAWTLHSIILEHWRFFWFYKAFYFMCWFCHIKPRSPSLHRDSTTRRSVCVADAISFAALTSQDPGVNPVANAVFGASWPIYPEVLTTALQMDKRFVEDLQLKTGSIPLLGPLKASHTQHVTGELSQHS